MPKRSSKDLNQTAFSIVQQATAQEPKAVQTSGPAKNPAAVALGRLGGLKGGKARAESLSKSRRKAIAKLAALKRWSKREPS